MARKTRHKRKRISGKSKNKTASLDQIRDFASSRSSSAYDVASKFGISVNQARASLRSLVRKGYLQQIRRGRYEPVDKNRVVDVALDTVNGRDDGLDEGLALLTPFLVNAGESISLLQFAERASQLRGKFKGDVRSMIAFFDSKMPDVVRFWWPALFSSPSHDELSTPDDPQSIALARLLAVISERKDKGHSDVASFALTLAYIHANSFDQELTKKTEELSEAIRSEILQTSDSLGTLERNLNYISRQLLLGLNVRTLIDDELLIRAICRAAEKVGLRSVSQPGSTYLYSAPRNIQKKEYDVKVDQI